MSGTLYGASNIRRRLGGGGSSLPTAVPDTMSLVFPTGSSTGTLDIVNTSDRPGTFQIKTITGPYTVSSVSEPQQPDSGYYVTGGGSVSIDFLVNLIGPQSGTVLIESTSGDYVIDLISNAAYVVQQLGAVVAYDFARMRADGDFVDGEIMAVLPDKSGNLNDGTATGSPRFGTSQFPSGAGGYAFSGANYFTMNAAAAAAMDLAGVGEVWTVSSHASVGGSAVGPVADFRGNASNDHHPLGDGRLYTSFGCTSGTSEPWSTNISPGRIVRWRMDSVTQQLHVRDMTAGVDIINSPQTFKDFSTGNAEIGHGPSSQYYNGTIGAVIVFDRYLSAPETTQLENYLQSAFGL